MRDPDEIKAEADAAARSGQFDNARDLYLAAQPLTMTLAKSVR